MKLETLEHVKPRRRKYTGHGLPVLSMLSVLGMPQLRWFFRLSQVVFMRNLIITLSGSTPNWQFSAITESLTTTIPFPRIGQCIFLFHTLWTFHENCIGKMIRELNSIESSIVVDISKIVLSITKQACLVDCINKLLILLEIWLFNFIKKYLPLLRNSISQNFLTLT